ncbi:hypothetical protein [Azospirillum largimobile]
MLIIRKSRQKFVKVRRFVTSVGRITTRRQGRPSAEGTEVLLVVDSPTRLLYGPPTCLPPSR